MKRKVSLILSLIMIIGLFSSWQIVNAATYDSSINVGQTKMYTPRADYAVETAAWSVHGNDDALQIVSQDDISCNVIGMKPTTGDDYAILRCDYYYFRNGLLMSGYTDYYITVNSVYVSSISVSPSNIVIAEGQDYMPEITVYPSGATRGFIYLDEPSGIVSFWEDGRITGRNPGTTTITIIAKYGGAQTTMTVTVTAAVKSLELKPEESMILGDTKELNLTVLPAEATGYSVEWKSSDENVVKISNQSNSSATLTAVGDGTATITASANGKSASCTVTVKRPEVQSISLPGQVSLLIQASKQLIPEILPAQADKSVQWSSNNENIVKVTADGTITGINEGKAVITAKTSNGLSAKCEVSVSLKTPQNITVSDITEKTYGDSSFVVTAKPDSTSQLNEFSFESSNTDVAEIAADGTVTIKAAGETDITVKQAGNDEYAAFTKTQKLVVKKAAITITADAKMKKIGASDPKLTYQVVGELVNGDSITGSLARKPGEEIGQYDILIGTLAINNNYDITYNKAIFEIVDKTPQNITVSDITEKTYGDSSFVVTVTPDATSQLNEFTFESSDTDVAEIIADGTVTIKAAGETDITVKQAGNEEYAAFEKTQKLVVNKKAITITSINGDDKTSVLEGVLAEDTAVALDYNKLNIEVTEAASDTTSNVTFTNFALTGDNAENYTITTENVVAVMSNENIVNITITADNGTVTGAGKYIKGSSVTAAVTPNNGYKFSGWYVNDTSVSTGTTYTFTANADTELVAKIARRSSGGGGSSYYTVKFDANGGTALSNQRIRRNAVAKAPEAPTKDGFTFEGWYTDKELTKEYDFATKVTKSITLYAKWAEIDKTENQIILTIGDKNAKVFGEDKANDVAPKIANNRTMLPARFVAESLGANVEWDGTAPGIVTITKDDIKIVIYIGEGYAVVNGEKVKLDSPAFIENNRTYTPLRFVAESLGAKVEWDEETQTVTITK